MTATCEEILSLYIKRRGKHGPIADQMRQVRDLYNGDIIVPLPEREKNEQSAVANLMAMGVDQISGRIASTVPNPEYPVMRPGIGTEIERARNKRRANLGWWEKNNMELKLQRRARHLSGYGESPVLIRPNFEWNAPMWEIKDPLGTYAAPSADQDDPCVSDVIFAVKQPYQWLRYRYPEKVVGLAKPVDCPLDMLFDVLEYIDADEIVTCVVGKVTDERYGQELGSNPGAKVVELERLVNRAGVCTALVPGRINLDRRKGQFDGMVGMYQAQAKLFALEMIAVEEGIWPNQWMVQRPNESAEIVSIADGRRGQIGLIKGADLHDSQIQPGYQTTNTINMLERNQRLAGGIPAEFGGECVDEATEILTADGWKRYDAVAAGDEVLTLNHETGMSEWQPILKMNVFPAERREVIEMEGPRFSALTTKNHRWPVLHRGQGRQWRLSSELNSQDRIPIAAMNADLPTEAKWSDALVELVAWYWTEGHRRESRAQLSQSETRNGENVERIRACLTSLFGPATQGWRVIKFDLSSHAALLLDEHAPGKVPTHSFLRSLTSAQLELFIHVSMLADNCGPDRLGQKDEARTEAFAFACVLSGRGVSYQHRTRVESRAGFRPGPYDTHIVRLRKRRLANPVENSQRGNSTFRTVTHDGMVWCPTTANGTWFARRKGSAYFTGNSASNVRTGRRGENILSATIDFGILEAQRVLQVSMQAENCRAIAVDKGYHDTTKSFYVGWYRAKGVVTYKPSDLFDTDQNIVSYAQAGADANGLVISLGQRVGLGTLSKRGMMESDPIIDDPEKEHDRVVYEALEGALLQSVEQQGAAGSLPALDMARIMQLVVENKQDLPGAIIQAQKEAQERQAQQVAASAPEAQPGLAQPGMGAEAQAAPQGPTPQGLAQMLGSLRRAQNQTPQEQGPVQAAV